MSDIAEGLGQAVEGALAAKAVAPESGAASSAQDTVTCSNCGADASGAYCWNCGQKLHVHPTLTAIGHDLMHGVLHLDGKLAHTLPLLAFKPGRLTRRYIEGERAKFVSPMSMFLFSVFAMFAVFQMIGLGVPTDLEGLVPDEQVAEIQGERAKLQARKTVLETMLASTPEGTGKAKLQDELDTIEGELTALELARALTGEEAAPAAEDPSETVLEPSTAIDTSPGVIEIDGDTSIPFVKKLAEKWNKNPGLMLYKMQANGYKFSWLLIPLSLPFVWLLFAWRSGIKAYDHTVFITYSLSFMSLLFIALSLLNAAGLSLAWSLTLFAALAPLHVYKHLRHSYGLSRFSAIWRFAVLTFSIILVMTLFLQALLLLGAF
ncbi:MAG: DUF3667 domain-containing protein [Pseudomonadota bacterium]